MTLLAGCSDEIKAPDQVPDGTTGITLCIPNPEGAAEFAKTRSENPDTRADQSAAEGKIVGNDLYFLAFGSGNNIVRKHLTDATLQTLSNDYKKTTIDLVPDTYRFYVVGNLSKYAPSGTNFNTISEDALKALVLEFNASSKELTPANGLPMACLPNQIKKGETVVSSGEYVIEPGDNPVIKADLSFLCAKVRYTILFDNAKGGISYEQFGPANFLDFNGASAKTLEASTKLVGDGVPPSPEDPFDLHSITLNKVENPASWLNYGVAKEEYTSNLATTTFSANQAKRTWQGVVYVPENLHNSLQKKTTLYFDGKVNGEYSNPYSIMLNNARGEGAGETRVLRAKFYDIVASAKSRDAIDIDNIEVHDWTTLNMVYGLHGQYSLHVDKTKITLNGGEPTSIWYNADTEISFESPEFNNSPLYKFSKTDDEITVSINPAITLDQYPSITSNLDQYSFFHIKAGTLVKKIDVELDLKAFLNVDPLEIVLNVRELKASGDYSGKMPVNIETNLTNITISKINGTNWELAEEDKVLSLSSLGNIPVVNGKYTVDVNYNGLNSSLDFWKTNRELSFTVTGVVSGETLSKTVVIKVEPVIDDYIIHLRADGWSNPHIYVYQCLELPADFWGVWNGESLASKPIGYSDKQNQYFAALEYSFTGKIAFKGWNEPENKKSLNEWDTGDKQYGEGHHGFFLFKDSYQKPDAACSWNAAVGESNARYNKNMDFCADQRNNGCKKCSSEYNNLWPGVRMKTTKADDGTTWYTFKLTGVATPGKALIMFTDGHNYSNGQNRYPGEAEVGVPLFDFPNREGWFNVADSKKEFKSSGPKISFVTTPPPTKTYKVYFKWNLHGKLNNLRIWNNDLDINVGGNYFDYNQSSADAGNGGTYYKGENGWACLQFSLTLENLPSTLDWGLVDDRWGAIPTDKFDSNNCLYIKDDNGHEIIPGLPY